MRRTSSFSALLVATGFLCLPLGAQDGQQVAGALDIPPETPATVMDLSARLQLHEVELEVALQRLQEASGVPVAYSPTLLSGDHRVSCACARATVRDAITAILTGTGFEARAVAGQLVIKRPGATGLSAPGPSMSREIVPLVRQGTITGMVTASGSQRPLEGVQMSIPGTGIGTLTNQQGRYLLVDVPTGTHTVRAQYIGYSAQTQEVTVEEGATVQRDFQLSQSAMELDEIVVTGTAGAQEMRSLGNTVGRVRAAELQQVAPAPGFEELLSGSEPGMTVDFGGVGSVGGSANIRIRGAASMALSSQPLLYIDGVRVNGGGTTDQGLGNSPPTRLNDLNPEEIESVEIIKGPAAATLYGTEASNGVINIITKRGTAGEPQISLRLGAGTMSYPNIEETVPNVYYRCRGTSGTCEPGEIVEFNVLRHDRIENGITHYGTGVPRNIGATVEGGTEAFRFFTALDYDQDRGGMPHDWKNQLNGRANLTWTPSEELDVQVGLAGIQSTLRDGGVSYILGTIWACPAPGCEAGSGTTYAIDGIYRGFLAFRPDVMRDSTFQYQEISRSQYNAQVTHRPTEWFTHRVVAGADWTEKEISNLELPINGVGHLNPQGQRSVQTGTTQYLSLDYSATATWDPSSSLSLATSAGVQYYQKEEDLVIASSNRFATQGLETLNAGSEQSVSEDFIENKTVGAYAQEQISWQNRLFLTLAMRGDDNSAFGTNFEAVIYPKASASWVMSEESFMENVSWIDQFRLRSAWGRAGQQPDAFAATRTMRPIAGPHGAGGLTFENFGNPDLEPEVGEEFEVGFDASLLRDRLGVEFTYYTQTRNKALIPVPVRPSTGFPGIQLRNLGEITNTGFELQLTGTPYRGRNTGLDLTLSVANNESEVVSMGDAPPLVLQTGNPTTGWSQQLFVEGFPLGAIWQKKVVSADIVGTGADAQAVNVMCEGGALLEQGTSGFPISPGGGAPVPCADAPNVYRGAPIPPWQISGSANLSLGSNLSLYAQVDYLGGHTMIDGNAAGSHLALFRHTRAILERTDPILLGIESLGVEGRNQSGLMDASFARLRRVGVTYTVPGGLADRLGADRMSVTLSGQNLGLLWRAQDEIYGHPSMDPEVRATVGEVTDPGGLTAYTQSEPPALRRFYATIRVTF